LGELGLSEQLLLLLLLRCYCCCLLLLLLNSQQLLLIERYRTAEKAQATQCPVSTMSG
jgi:hypothetical protein